MTSYLNQLIDDAKDRANIGSDNALSTVLGISSGWISEYRKEPPKRHPSTEVATKLAILSGRAEMRVIAEIELMTAKTEQKREFWKQYIESRGIAATLGLIALGTSLILTPEPAEAGILQLQNYDEISNVHESSQIYIMRISGRSNPERFAVQFCPKRPVLHSLH